MCIVYNIHPDTIVNEKLVTKFSIESVVLTTKPNLFQ